MVKIEYSSVVGWDGGFRLEPFKAIQDKPALRLSPSDIFELPELSFPKGYPARLARRRLAKLLAIWFRCPIELKIV